MAGLGQGIVQGATLGTAIGGPAGTVIGAGIGVLAGIGSLLTASSKKTEALEQINVLTGKRESATSAMGELSNIEAQRIGIAEDQYGTAESKAIMGVGSSLFSATRAGMTAASNIGFAGSGQLQRQMETGQRDIISDFGFQKQGLQDLLGQNLLNISTDIGGQRAELETKIESIDAEIKKNKRKASTGGFFKSLLGG